MFPGISEPSRLTETKDRALNVTPEILTQQAKDPEFSLSQLPRAGA